MGIIKGFISSILVLLLILSIGILGLIITVNVTILNPDFVLTEMDKFDMYTVILDEIKEQIPEEVPTEALDDMLDYNKPWLKEQTHDTVHSVYAFVKGKESLYIKISLEPLKADFEQNKMIYIRSFLPPALQKAPDYIIEPYITTIYNQIEDKVPDSVEFNESSLSPQIMASLEIIKDIVDYVKYGYMAAVSLIIVSLLLLALIHRWHFKPTALYTGIAFVMAGIISLINVLLVRSSTTGLNLLGLESVFSYETQVIVDQLLVDITHPLLFYGTGFTIAGIALLVSSIVLRR